jgi:hypothetical protein
MVKREPPLALTALEIGKLMIDLPFGWFSRILHRLR